MDDWVEKNIDRIDIEDLAEVDNIRSNRKYLAIFGFLLGWVPQYYIVNSPEFLSESRGLKRYVKAGIIGALPLITCYLFNSYGVKRKDRLTLKLIEKYGFEEKAK